jgi:ribosomal protein S4E
VAGLDAVDGRVDEEQAVAVGLLDLVVGVFLDGIDR